jgi:spore coat protein U-like protein
MKNIKNKIITSLVCMALMPISLSGFAAGNSVANPKATATISSSCTISAQNLAFGNLVLPVSAQSASTNMSVLCSKNAPYTIGLAYGGVYGTTQNVSSPYVNTGAYKYIQGGQALYWVCTYIASGPNGQTADTTSISATGQCPSTYQSYTFSSSYAYGKMGGVISGDNVAYSIQVPNSPGKIWNTGNSSYSSTGTGASQTIPVAGTLVPSQTTNKFPTPDTYTDTVSATVSF